MTSVRFSLYACNLAAVLNVWKLFLWTNSVTFEHVPFTLFQLNYFLVQCTYKWSKAFLCPMDRVCESTVFYWSFVIFFFLFIYLHIYLYNCCKRNTENTRKSTILHVKLVNILRIYLTENTTVRKRDTNRHKVN